jgi:protocatechuate 4,5-dioxygenase alpha chain
VGVPDITVFTGERSRQGYRINKLSSSLTNPANRQSFLADEDAYCRRFGLTEEERQLIADRDWNGIVAAGGNIYVFIKIAATIGTNLLEMGADMRGESVEEFLATRPANQDR